MEDENGQPTSAGQRQRWPWWHRQSTRTRRTVRTSLALLVTGVLSAVLGVLTASAESSLGPHAASYSVTPQHEIVVDLGPLGAVLLDSPLPWPLGVEVDVHEIPMELSAVPASPVTGLAGDLAAYAQVASHPGAVVAEAAGALVRDALGRTVIIWSALLLVAAAGRFASRGLLRREVTAAARRPGVAPLAGVVAASLVVVPTVDALGGRSLEGTTIQALSGTPMADLRMTGRVAQLIDTYGGVLVDAYEENEAFYSLVSENLETAYADSRTPLRPPSIPIVSPAPVDPAATEDTEQAPAGPVQGAAPPPDGAPAGAPDDGAPADDVAPGNGEDAPTLPELQTPSPSAEESPPARVEPVTMLMVSDLHCNVGMATVIADAVRLSGAEALLDGGDTVMSGTAVESYCVNAFAGALPDDVPVVVSTGNHDSVTTADQMRDAGYLVLDGDVVDVAGVQILGDTDPTLTAIGEGTRPEREETVPEMGERLAERACEAERVDLLLVHNPRAALPSMEQGCARLALSGHWHRREGPEVIDRGTRYVSSSTAGASGGATVGPLNGPAEMTVLRVDAVSGRPLDYRIITIDTEADVELGRWYRFPEPADVVPPSGDTGGAGSTEDLGEGQAGTERE